MKIIKCDLCHTLFEQTYFLQNILTVKVKSSKKFNAHPDTKNEEMVNIKFDICKNCYDNKFLPSFRK